MAKRKERLTEGKKLIIGMLFAQYLSSHLMLEK